MMLQALRSYTRGRRSPTALALPPLLLALVVLPGANQAAAQELPEVEVYHSLHPEGVDPRSETCPPGCDCNTGGGETVTIDFDELPAMEPIPDTLEGATFYTSGDYEVIVLPGADELGNSKISVNG